MILALDIGGTKVTLATFQQGPEGLLMGPVQRYETHEFPALEQLLEHHFGGKVPKLRGIGIGLAGPVLGRTVKLTNLPWSIHGNRLQTSFGAPVFLLNDLEAHGHAIAIMEQSSLISLQTGVKRDGNAALIAAGTGLGEAFLVWHEGAWIVSPSEGGHATFGPSEPQDIELCRFLQDRFTHVSWERVVSGLEGFRNLYDFMLARGGDFHVPDAWREALREPQDIGALIFKAAEAGEGFARALLGWFTRLYGSEAGNLALKSMAIGGLYIAGGIAGHLLPYLQEGGFARAFSDKGRFNGMLADVPIHIITDPHAALKGAAHYTAQKLRQ